MRNSLRNIFVLAAVMVMAGPAHAAQPVIAEGYYSAGQYYVPLSVDINGNLTGLGLPTGASTAANQTAVQSAPGTPQTMAVTVQGNAAGVPVPTTDTNSAASKADLDAINTATASTSTNLTNGNQKSQMYDGTNTIGTSAHPVRVDPTGTTTQPVSQNPTAIALSDNSSTVASGGTSQQITGANASRHVLMFFNLNASGGDTLYLNFGAAATSTNSMPIPPGGGWISDAWDCPSGSINVLGATTGDKYMEKEN